MSACATCRYFHAEASIALATTAPQGECRRYPPARSDFLAPQGMAMVCGWPTVRRNFWCGEWAAPEQKEA